MSAALEAEVIVREKRQITLPADLCRQLGIQVGDHLEVTLEGNALIARPKKAMARQALRELQAVFASSGVGEVEIQEYARKIREQLSAERYGQKP
jgi:AbrB family looped-hinge helix DNA binding protein